MTDDDWDGGESERADGPGSGGPDVDDVPTVSCSRCDRTWDLAYELDDLQVGNRALEQFALDHQRHTGHFPDGITPWLVDCRVCPDEEAFLSETPARRWAETHARHTRHSVDVHPPESDDVESVEPDGTESG